MKKLMLSALTCLLLAGFGCERVHRDNKQAALERWQGVRVKMAVEQAQQQLQSGDYTLARKTALDALDVDPDHIPAKVVLGRILLQQDELSSAKLVLLEVLQMEPEYAEAHYTLAVIYEKWRQGGKALEHYRHAHAADPMHNPYALAVAETLASQDAGEEALRVLFDQMDRVGPEDELLYTGGAILMRQGHYAEAVEMFVRARRLAPDSETIAESLAFALHRAGRFEHALAVFQELVQRYTDKPASRYDATMGDCYLQLGRYHRAVRALENAVRRQPGNVQTQVKLAQAYLARKQIAMAGTTARQAAQLGDSTGAAELVLGYVSFQHQAYDQAVGHFRSALRADPDNGLAFCMLGRALQAQGHHDQAVVCFQDALSLNPDDRLAQASLASLTEQVPQE